MNCIATTNFLMPVCHLNKADCSRKLSALGNSYFHFKQFSVNQDQSAMKVSTDACLFGALIPVRGNDTVLDIGTGTGLLSLMLAQKCNCEIDAVELDAGSYQQAVQNIALSPWSSRIKVHHKDIRLFQPGKKYSLIVCNPPFFENHLRSAIDHKNTAKHADQLPFRDLITAVKTHLKSDGLFAVLLPAGSTDKLLKLAAIAGLQVVYQVYISDNINRPPKRIVTIFSADIRQKNESFPLHIKNAAGSYSTEFQELLQPYYLNF